MRLLYLFGVAIFFLMAMVSAAQVDVDYNVTVDCKGFTCSNVNITILNPNSTTLINNQPMISNGYYASYELTPSTNGVYTFFYSDGANSSSGTFIATPSGYSLSIGTSILYSIMLIFLVFIFCLTLYFGIKIQGENNRNVEGEIISINWRKYLKLFNFSICYASMTGILFVLWTLSWAFLEWQNLGTFFYYWFRLWFVAGMLIVPGIFIYGMVHYIQDKKIENFINKMGIPFYNGK